MFWRSKTSSVITAHAHNLLSQDVHQAPPDFVAGVRPRSRACREALFLHVAVTLPSPTDDVLLLNLFSILIRNCVCRISSAVRCRIESSVLHSPRSVRFGYKFEF